MITKMHKITKWPFSWIIVQVEKKRRVMLFQFSCASRDGRGYWGRWYLWRWWWWCWRSTWMIVTRGDLNFKLLAYTLDPCFGHLRESWKNYFWLKSVALSSWFITAPKCHGDPILSEMGTIASTNGDPKNDFLKIVAALTFSAFLSLKWRKWGP